VKKIATIWVVALAAGLLAACAPLFGTGAALTATPLGPLVTLSWTPATPDPDKTVASYDIEVNGTQVAVVSGSTTSCVLTGLAANTSYTLSVTSTDNTGAWSGTYTGDLAASGRLSTPYTTPAATGASAGATMGCVATTDTDGDRLPDAVETGTGTFVSAAATGTNAAVADTDGDGIKDGDETLGTTGGLNLYGMGARPVKKNLLFEFDWFDDNNDPGICAAHSHRPSATAVGKVATAFANAPVANPDGSTGITVISDYGQGGLFTGGNLIADADGVIAGGVNDADFASIKAAQFAANREGYFHYTLMPHRYGLTSNSSGQAELPGDDLIVSLYCYGSDGNVANTIVHEVGHNLNLRHGGFENVNYKPNYNSVMNYEYQFPGVDTNCTVPGDGLLDYSRGTRAALNENALVETDGICGGVDIDWSGNGLIDAGTVSVNLNFSYDSVKTTLQDHDDWGNILLSGVLDGDGASVIAQEIITEQPVPESAR
jgi:hypothetical protein